MVRSACDLNNLTWYLFLMLFFLCSIMFFKGPCTKPWNSKANEPWQRLKIVWFLIENCLIPERKSHKCFGKMTNFLKFSPIFLGQGWGFFLRIWCGIRYVCSLLGMVLNSGHIIGRSCWGHYAILKIAALRSKT